MAASVSPGGSLPLQGQIVLAATGTLASSSSVSETTLFTAAIPAGTLQPNDGLLIEPVYRFTGAAGTRTLRIKIGPTLGSATTVWSAAHASTQLSSQPHIRLRGRNSLTSQVASWVSNTGTASADGYASSSTDVGLFTLDFGIDQNLYVTAQLAVGTDVAEQLAVWLSLQPCRV